MSNKRCLIKFIVFLLLINIGIAGCTNISSDSMPNETTITNNPLTTSSAPLVWQGTLAAHPASPALNWAYYNSTDKKSYIWNGSAWQILSESGANGANGTNGIGILWQGTLAAHPASPALNWAYYNSTDKKSYIWNGSAWQTLAQDGTSSSLSFGGGDGSRSNPFLIATAEQLHLVRNHLNKHFVQVADIDLDHALLSLEPWYDVASGWLPIGPDDVLLSGFGGSFNGNNYKIKNLMLNRAGNNLIGLFTKVENGATIQNVRLSDHDITLSATSSGYSGALAAHNYGIVKGCISSGSIVGREAGGLIGRNEGSVINCSSTGTVGSLAAAHLWSGGLVCVNNGTVSKCYSNSNVSANIHAGGLIMANYGIVNKCFSTGTVSASSQWAGGLVAASWDGSIEDCYSTSNVSTGGFANPGGLVATNPGGTVARCYSAGSVGGGTSPGGFMGGNAGSVLTSYWDTQTSGQAASAAGTGKLTAAMKQQAEFVGWDFATVWEIDENTTYPYLKENRQSPLPQ